MVVVYALEEDDVASDKIDGWLPSASDFVSSCVRVFASGQSVSWEQLQEHSLLDSHRMCRLYSISNAI